ncbi:C-X-C motif chemokine 11-1-like isoform X2 [Alosa sapidissima]|uniref:C-X-C motif chemokine 11-1-like isoform X2 n=1 Tax=Alosa sapidissima TaxID=34773 RepID=UPI001C09B9CA|nr:C-X-C motif chemokine 11-1-like isoform X2 [Alosa sapidissima]
MPPQFQIPFVEFHCKDWNGVPMNRSQRCSCRGKPVNVVRCSNISAVGLFPPSASCDNLEIVVKLKKGGGPICLNPASRMGKKVLSSNPSPNQWKNVQCAS